MERRSIRQEVREAYADRCPGMAYGLRDLDYTSPLMDIETVYSLTQIIGEYNNFDPQRVNRKFHQLHRFEPGDDLRVSVGRRGSPELIVETSDAELLETLFMDDADLIRNVHDEHDFDDVHPDRTLISLWWD